MDTHAPRERPIPRRYTSHSRPLLSRWLARCLAVVWLLSVALWVQFAVASIEEMEPQAVTLGAIVAAILIVGGLTLWGARRRTRGR